MTKEDIKNVCDVVHKTICGFFDTCGDNEEELMTDKDELLLEVNKAICNNIKALERTTWIPVSERLPENNGAYLVCGHGKIWICETFNLCGVMGWCNDAKNPIVEAWMPFPEPYKVEK